MPTRTGHLQGDLPPVAVLVMDYKKRHANLALVLSQRLETEVSYYFFTELWEQTQELFLTLQLLKKCHVNCTFWGKSQRKRWKNYTCVNCFVCTWDLETHTQFWHFLCKISKALGNRSNLWIKDPLFAKWMHQTFFK